MSILLRKACQKTLNNAGLNEYHAVVNTSQSHFKKFNLRIAGSCGKPLVDIVSIQFARNTPNKAEIDYTVELLEEYLSNNLKALKDYVAAMKAYSDSPAPQDPNNLYYIYGSKPTDKELDVAIRVEHKDFWWYLSPKGQVVNLQTVYCSSSPTLRKNQFRYLTEFLNGKLTLPNDVINEALKFYKSHIETHKAYALVDKCKSVVDTCTI